MPPATIRCTALLAAAAGLVAPPPRARQIRLHSTATQQDLGTTTAPLLDDAAIARAVSQMREDARTSPLSDDELAWFARDRRGDAREAVEKVVSYIRWRKDRGGLGADRDALMKQAAPEARRRVGYLAREKDALNRPTVVVVARRHDAMRRDLKASQALCVAVLEDAIAKAQEEGGEQVLALVDLRQVGPQNVDVPFLLWLIMTLRSYFPKRLGQVALVDPPPVLFEAVRLRRPLLPIAYERDHAGLEFDQGRGRPPRGHGSTSLVVRCEERVLRGEARAAGPKVILVRPPRRRRRTAPST